MIEYGEENKKMEDPASRRKTMMKKELIQEKKRMPYQFWGKKPAEKKDR